MKILYERCQLGCLCFPPGQDADKARPHLTRNPFKVCVDLCPERDRMEAPATSGRPPAGFMTLTSSPLLYHSTAGSTSQGSLAQGSHVDFSSQQPSAPTRLPTRAWLPSFRLGGSGSNKWSNKSHLHRPFALGVGAGTGGSMLVSLH